MNTCSYINADPLWIGLDILMLDHLIWSYDPYKCFSKKHTIVKSKSLYGVWLKFIFNGNRGLVQTCFSVSG